MRGQPLIFEHNSSPRTWWHVITWWLSLQWPKLLPQPCLAPVVSLVIWSGYSSFGRHRETLFPAVDDWSNLLSLLNPLWVFKMISCLPSVQVTPHSLRTRRCHFLSLCCCLLAWRYTLKLTRRQDRVCISGQGHWSSSYLCVFCFEGSKAAIPPSSWTV